MGQVTLDYTVPLTVTVDTDSGQVLRVLLNGEEFQGSSAQPEQIFAGSSAEYEAGEVPEYLERDHPLATAALALGDRVVLAPVELFLPFALYDEASDSQSAPTFGAILGPASVAEFQAVCAGVQRDYDRKEPPFRAAQAVEREIDRQAATRLAATPRERTSPLAG